MTNLEKILIAKEERFKMVRENMEKNRLEWVSLYDERDALVVEISKLKGAIETLKEYQEVINE